MPQEIDLLRSDLAGPFRGNLHCHSTKSDGMQALGAVCDAYRQAGYDFVAVSDHFEPDYGWRISDTSDFAHEDFVTLVGAELSSGPWLDRATYWVAAVGLPRDFEPAAAGETARDVIRRAHAGGAYVVLLHPGLNHLRDIAVSDEDFAAIDAVEIHTHSMQGTWPDQASGSYFLDGALERGLRLHVNAGDDAHFNHRNDRFGAWIELRAKSLEPDAIMDSLKNGNHYATQGPKIESLVQNGNQLLIRTTPAYSIVLSGGGDRWMSATQRVADDDLGVTEAEFKLGPFAGAYCRVVVVDRQGRRAWSNPIWP